MDVRIGVIDTPKEVEIVMGESSTPEEVRATIDTALASGETLWLTDRRGRQVGVPTAKLAYVEIGVPNSERRVGFGG